MGAVCCANDPDALVERGEDLGELRKPHLFGNLNAGGSDDSATDEEDMLAEGKWNGGVSGAIGARVSGPQARLARSANLSEANPGGGRHPPQRQGIWGAAAPPGAA